MDASRLPRLTDSRPHAPSSSGDRRDSSVVVDSQMVERVHNSRMAGGRRREQRQRRGSSASTDFSSDECCCCPSCCSRNCNTQICCSYFFAILSSGLVVGGVYLSVVQWNRLWLSISVFGLVLVFFGACLYCCGTRALSHKHSRRDESDEFDDRFDDEPVVEDSRQRRPGRNKRKRRNRPEDLEESVTDRRINAARSLSQLSLNMIPQYFAPSDTGSTAPGQLLATSSRTNTLMTTASAGAQSQAASVPFSQIFSLNGQSFLILPIANESLEASRQRNSTSSEQSIPLNSLVVKVPSPEHDSIPTDESVRRPTVTEFLAKLDPKSYCLFKSGQTQSSFFQQTDDTAVRVEEDSSLASVPSSHNLNSSRPSISCEDSGIYSNSQTSQAKNAPNDSTSVFVPMNAGTSAAASCASSSVTSADVSSPSSSSSSGMAAASHARHHNQKDAKSHPPKPAARITKSVPGTGPSVVAIDHKKSSVPDSGGAAPGSQESATISNSFFISFPSNGSGKRSEKGNPRTAAFMQASTSTASTSFQDNQKARHQRKDSSVHSSAHDQNTDELVPVAGPSFASPASLVRKDTFSSKKKSVKPLLTAQPSESSSEISSPNEEPAGNLIDLMDRRRDSRAEAEAERSHAVFASSRYEELVYDSSDLDDTEFLSPPPSYSEVVDSAMHFASPSTGPSGPGTL